MNLLEIYLEGSDFEFKKATKPFFLKFNFNCKSPNLIYEVKFCGYHGFCLQRTYKSFEYQVAEEKNTKTCGKTNP